eukprot:TRINITY_DN44169_c0_g1_i1.p1 TRINITY_DN44169_c0_g1~~TRINITY_DN44169_c0_g1_i1.p1  ORF type:complete len:371 (+),score=28.47 TRINITY_DN44169_c0_g1_i1:72-1184(+)
MQSRSIDTHPMSVYCRRLHVCSVSRTRSPWSPRISRVTRSAVAFLGCCAISQPFVFVGSLRWHRHVSCNRGKIQPRRNLHMASPGRCGGTQAWARSSGIPQDFLLSQLHVPVVQSTLANWVGRAFDDANAWLFGGRLHLSTGIVLDSQWHTRGGAGGAQCDAVVVGSGRIVLDPSRHSSLRELCSTLLHEMVHLDVGDADGPNEHGEAFLEGCHNLNNRIASATTIDVSDSVSSGNGSHQHVGSFCRLGEMDLIVDGQLLRAARVHDVAAARFLRRPETHGGCKTRCGGALCSRWDEGLLVGDLRASGADDGSIQRVLSLCLSAAVRRARAASGGFFAWDVRSRTLARHFATRHGRDYCIVEGCDALWGL